ncbi:hypothetical protein WJX77_009153 [Trebouxia sp. C0004]
MSDKQYSSVHPDGAQMTQHAKQLGSSSGLAAAWCQCVHEKAQGQLQPGDGNNGIMVQKMQQLSGVSAMSDQAGTNSKPSFSQAQGSAPPSGASSPSSGLKTEAATGSLTAANGLLDDAQQQQQKAALGPHGPMPQQDSGKAELYASMMGPMYEQHGMHSDREGLAARAAAYCQHCK